jgi:hypothetical protein
MNSDKITDAVRKSWKLFKSFHRKDPRNGQLIRVAMEKSDEALEVGQFFGIAYISGGDIYFHKFNKRNRPLVFVSSDGRQIYILKGGYKFTDRGFIG